MRHLNNYSSSSSATSNSDNFDIMNKKMCQMIKCDIISCKMHVRYNRDRQRIDDELNKEINEDYNSSFFINILDNMH